jgi:hypothetical protein
VSRAPVRRAPWHAPDCTATRQAVTASSTRA